MSSNQVRNANMSPPPPEEGPEFVTSSPKLNQEMKSNALHGSLTSIYRPKNYRSRLTLPHLPPNTSNSSASAVECHTPGCSKPSPLEVEADNLSMYKYIKDQKREILLRKAITAFVYAGLKRSSENIARLEYEREFRIQQCAARRILHVLLLNAWRDDKMRLERLTHENAQFTISVENLNLQLRVLRHLQNTEKERANEKSTEIRTIKNQISMHQKLLKNTMQELANVQEELKYTLEDRQKLEQQAIFVEKELKEMVVVKDKLTTSLELEKRRANQAEESTNATKAEYTDLRKQMKELSQHTFQCHERCKNFQSKGEEMEKQIELRETSLKIIESNVNALMNELEQTKMKKSALEDAYEEARIKLLAERQNSKELEVGIERTKGTIESQQDRLVNLEGSMVTLRAENKQLQEELYGYKLKNLRNRRAWVNATNSPINLVKFLIFGNVK